MQVAELLDRAKKVTGNDSQTAFALRVAPSVVSDWRKGRRTCTIESQIRIAALAGMDPREVTEPYIEETLKGTPWLEAGMRAMGKALAGVVAITCAWALPRADAHAAEPRATHDNVYYVNYR